MSECEVGDDVWDLDPTVRELEQYAAQMFGKESALFMPSSCMANLAAIMAHTIGRGEEILVGDKSHISLYEQGNVSTIAGVHARTIENYDDGTFDLDDLKIKIRPHNVHFPKTSVVCIETSHNMCSGAAVPQEFIEQVHAITDPLGIKIHIDGARILNSTTALGIDPAAYVAHADSVACCLSKGLAAPIGAVLVGKTDFIKKAKHIRKALGGGMRQAGVLACCGLIGLKEMSKRLIEDHNNAKKFYDALASQPGVLVNRPDTNIVKFSLSPDIYPNVNLGALVNVLTKLNVFMITVDEGRSVRAVMHYHITTQDVAEAASVVEATLRDIRDGKLVLGDDGVRMY
jgi:threonine aldolase